MTQQFNSLAGLKILLAEDESLIALDIAGMLEGFGCEVIGPFAHVDEIAKVVDAEIDGALLDINLRGRQVFEVLPDLLARKVKVLLISGYDDATLFPVQFRSLPRLSKPINEPRLLQACRQYFLELPAAASAQNG